MISAVLRDRSITARREPCGIRYVLFALVSDAVRCRFLYGCLNLLSSSPLLAGTPAFGSVAAAGGGLFHGTDGAERVRGLAVSGAKPRLHRDLFGEALRMFQRFDGKIDIEAVPVNAPAVGGHVAQFLDAAMSEPRKIGEPQKELPLQNFP